MTWSFPDVYLVVSDEVFSAIALEVNPLIFKAYSVENQKSTKETSKRLDQLGAGNGQPTLEGLEHASMFTYYSEYREGLESAGLNIFRWSSYFPRLPIYKPALYYPRCLLKQIFYSLEINHNHNQSEYNPINRERYKLDSVNQLEEVADRDECEHECTNKSNDEER
jgi:hypothetical protein